MRKRCPACGGNGLFATWFRLRERCPTCGLGFEREEGGFLGAFVVNVAVTEAAMLVAVVAGVALTLPDPSVPLLVALGVLTTVVVPILAYPWSRTVWLAIDLAVHPLDPWEDAERVVRTGG